MIDNFKLHKSDIINLKENFHLQIPIGAVIVDPETDLVVAKSHDLRHGNHGLQHAGMVCIDMVAKSQGGGMWKYEGIYRDFSSFPSQEHDP